MRPTILPTLFRALILTLLATAPPVFSQGIIEGRVTLTGRKAAPVVNQRYSVISKGDVLSIDPPMAVIYLEGKFPASAGVPQAQMVQKDLRFVTPLLPVRVGTKVEFPNQDDTYHNVFSFSKAKRFDLGRYRPDERPIPSQVFDKEGLVTLHCDIHEHMRALILVLDTPHFTKSDAEGRYKLAGLPAGQYTLKAWVDSKTTLEKAVEIKPGTTLRIDFP
jgi:plastocyanin